MTLGQQICLDTLVKFPDTPTLTLAKKIYAENVEVFNSLEAARACLRRVRKKHFKTPENKIPKNKNPFDDLPEGLKDYGQWDPVAILDSTILILADAHIPYHDTNSLRIALEYGQDIGVEGIMLLGDWIDFFSISLWIKDPRRRNIQNELDTCHTILGIIREAFPDANIYYLLGNHEERLERYLRVKAPELLGYRALEFAEMIDSRDFGIRIIDQKRIVKIGKLNCIHGHEFGRTISNPVNPARGLYLRGKDTAICGHFHQTSQHVEKGMTGRITTCWSVGCLCDLRPEYRPMNKWNHGFAIVLNDSGDFQVLNKSIINGKVY